MNKEAAKKLIAKRNELGITQQSMAEKLADALNQSYSQRQYQKLEEGRFPKYKKEIVEKLDKILNTNLFPLVYEQHVPRETLLNEPQGTYLEKRLQQKNTTQREGAAIFESLPSTLTTTEVYRDEKHGEPDFWITIPFCSIMRTIAGIKATSQPRFGAL